MFKYSKELVQRTITYFKEVYDHIIDEEIANDYLDGLADLYTSFIEFVEYKAK